MDINQPMSRETIVKLKLSKKFKFDLEVNPDFSLKGEVQVNCIDFDISGRLAAVVANDHSINLFQCKYGKKINTLYSKKYGVAKLNFLTDNSVIFSSSKLGLPQDIKSHCLRLLDFETNTFLKYFAGHLDYVLQLQVNPADRTFISTSLDDTCLVWDCRNEKPINKFPTPGRDGLAIDPTGRVIAVADNRFSQNPNSNRKGGILLYDIRNLSKGGFKLIDMNAHLEPIDRGEPLEIGAIKFTNCGERLVIRDTVGTFQIRDALSGLLTNPILSQPCAYLNPEDPNAIFTLTPDGKFLLVGASDGKIDVFDLNLNTVANRDPHCHQLRTKYQPVYQTKKVSPNWRITAGDHAAVHAVQFNPKYFTLVAGDTHIKLFEPRWWL